VRDAISKIRAENTKLEKKAEAARLAALRIENARLARVRRIRN